MKKFGVVEITAFIASTVVVCLFLKFGFAADNDLKLQDWGGYISAATSSVALIWLVAGYAVQRKSLEQQVKELANIVANHQDQIQLANKQFEYEKQLTLSKFSPNFMVKYAKVSVYLTELEPKIINILLFNDGTIAKNVQLLSTPNLSSLIWSNDKGQVYQPDTMAFFRDKDAHSLQWDASIDGLPSNVTLTLKFARESDSLEDRQSFDLSLNPETLEYYVVDKQS